MPAPQPTERFVREMTRCQPSVFAFIMTLAPNADTARDILQNTNVVLWQKSAQFRDDTNFLAWAKQVARLEVLAYLRDHARDRHVFDDALLGRLAARQTGTTSDPDERARAFETCLDTLPPRQRTLISARYAPGGSVQEMAVELGQSPGALSVTLSRIRRGLADCVRRKLLGGAAS